MRFTFLLPADNLTGGTRVVAVYAKELQALGHQVLVISCAPDKTPWLRQLRRGFRNRVGNSVAGHIALSGVPHKVMERPGPIGAGDVPDADVLIATWWETAVWMASMPNSKGRKVHLIQGYEVWFGPHYAPQVQAALRLPNIKIAISRDLKNTIEAELGDLQLALVPNAVDARQFDAPVRARNAVPCVGFIYAHAHIKGADICIEACRLARLKLPQLRVLAFGTEPVAGELPLPTDCRYFLRPAQEALRLHYAACDAWLFGSRLDSFGLPVLEAMACRTPVIAVPIGAAPDLIAGGGGELVAKESAQQMADAIVRLCSTDLDQWRAMSDKAYATAHNYTWADATKRLLSIITVQ